MLIIGGGPAGSTCGTLLRKYNPSLRVLILERETFPRDHVGESLLPPLSQLLNEMGCWEKVEAAGFPIKLGATYKWGKSKELWDFEFYPAERFVDEPRPAKYAGQRLWTAFQVDRSVYDTILLDHSASLGCEVRQNARVSKVHAEGDLVMAVEMDDGEMITGRHYVDASGHSGILRRSLGVETNTATSLQNIAIWNYWENADWAVEIGVGGTRVQVMSVGYGWLWFIPLGPTRTSVGLVIPVEYYKESGKRPAELYSEALASQENIAALMVNAVSEGNLQTTKDWSFISTRHIGENWSLVGESAGFADPILAAGLTMAQVGAKEAAIAIQEILKGELDEDWIKQEFEERQMARISSHIRFADYWYTANAQFTDLKEFTAVIASENGLDLSPDKAWAWLAQGGFIDSSGALGPAGFPIDHVRNLGEFLADIEPSSAVKSSNVFRMNLEGAVLRDRVQFGMGRIEKTPCYSRGGRHLPVTGIFKYVIDLLAVSSELPEIVEEMKRHIAEKQDPNFVNNTIGVVPHALEAMISDGWVDASFDPSLPTKKLPERVGNVLHWNTDNR